jgi:hypothetical protein
VLSDNILVAQPSLTSLKNGRPSVSGTSSNSTTQNQTLCKIREKWNSFAHNIDVVLKNKYFLFVILTFQVGIGIAALAYPISLRNSDKDTLNHANNSKLKEAYEAGMDPANYKILNVLSLFWTILFILFTIFEKKILINLLKKRIFLMYSKKTSNQVIVAKWHFFHLCISAILSLLVTLEYVLLSNAWRTLEFNCSMDCVLVDPNLVHTASNLILNKCPAQAGRMYVAAEIMNTYDCPPKNWYIYDETMNRLNEFSYINLGLVIFNAVFVHILTTKIIEYIGHDLLFRVNLAKGEKRTAVKRSEE